MRSPAPVEATLRDLTHKETERFRHDILDFLRHVARADAMCTADCAGHGCCRAAGHRGDHAELLITGHITAWPAQDHQPLT